MPEKSSAKRGRESRLPSASLLPLSYCIASLRSSREMADCGKLAGIGLRRRGNLMCKTCNILVILWCRGSILFEGKEGLLICISGWPLRVCTKLRVVHQVTGTYRSLLSSSYIFVWCRRKPSHPLYFYCLVYIMRRPCKSCGCSTPWYARLPNSILLGRIYVKV